MSHVEEGPPPRDPVRERLDGLLHLRVDTHKPTEEAVRENLSAWLKAGGTAGADIRLRRNFVARVPPATDKELADAGEITDNRKSDLVRVPPLAVLTALPRGIALRCALTLIFLAQTHRRAALGREGLLKIPVDTDDAPPGLLHLIAIPAKYEGGSAARWGGGVKSNRQRQIREALKRLAGDDLKMIALPAGGRGVPRFNQVHLRNEVGGHGVDPAPYKAPAATAPTLSIPAAFFVNGWIHTLTNREIAAWLMLRDLTTQALPDNANAAVEGVRASTRARLTVYDLRKRTLDTSRELESFGLVEVIRDEENRRPNGTTRGGVRAEPNRYRLTDAGLEEPALPIVVKHLEAELAP